jgi:HEAT repeat protein
MTRTHRAGRSLQEIRELLTELRVPQLLLAGSFVSLGLTTADLPVLRRLLKPPQKRPVRRNAAFALVQFGEVNEEVLAALREAITDDSLVARVGAAAALGRFGAGHPEVVDAILAALPGPDEDTSEALVGALGRIGKDRPEAGTALLNVLRGGGPASIRAQAAKGLTGMGWGAAEVVVESLLGALNDPDPLLRRAAAEALGKTPEPPGQVISALLTALLRDSEDSLVRRAAAESLAQAGRGQSTVVDALVAMLGNSPDAGLQQACACALGRLGTARHEVVTALLHALKKGDAAVRLAAVRALGQLESTTEPVVHALRAALLKDPEPRVRAAAAEAVAGRLPQDPAVLDALVHMLTEPGRVGTSAQSSLPRPLQEHLRARAAHALKRMGPTAVPVLVALLSLPDPIDRLAAECLAAIGETALPALENALPTATEEVGAWMLYTLGKMALTVEGGQQALDLVEQVQRRFPENAFSDEEIAATLRSTLALAQAQKNRDGQAMPEDTEEETLRRIEAKAAALMAELPVDEGYQAFESAHDRVNRALERAFTPRLGQALTNHLVRCMKHDNYEAKKESSTWLNRELRKHKHALAFPGSDEPSNLRAIDAGYRKGRYCIERRTDQACARPQELNELLPSLRFIAVGPRKRATREEMQRRTLAERELERRGRGRLHGHGEE